MSFAGGACEFASSVIEHPLLILKVFGVVLGRRFRPVRKDVVPERLEVKVMSSVRKRR